MSTQQQTADLPDQCDFCTRVLDDDENLEPIYIGGLPEPQPQHLEKIDRKTVDYVIRGKSVDTYVALEELLRETDNIDFTLNDCVIEDTGPVEFVEGDATPPIPSDSPYERNYDKVGATLTIRPHFEDEPEPDLEVCEMGASSLKNERRA